MCTRWQTIDILTAYLGQIVLNVTFIICTGYIYLIYPSEKNMWLGCTENPNPPISGRRGQMVRPDHHFAWV